MNIFTIQIPIYGARQFLAKSAVIFEPDYILIFPKAIPEIRDILTPPDPDPIPTVPASNPGLLEWPPVWNAKLYSADSFGIFFQ